MGKIKLIWDFRGPQSKEIANHHLKHLIEFFKDEKDEVLKSGVEFITPYHNIVYAIVFEKDVQGLKAKLKPNRAQREKRIK